MVTGANFASSHAAMANAPVTYTCVPFAVTTPGAFATPCAYPGKPSGLREAISAAHARAATGR
jgi:hypothetical protein